LLHAVQSQSFVIVPTLHSLHVIDDGSGSRRSLSNTLARRGYEPLLYATGEDALLNWDASVRLVILDIKLPRMKGNEVYRKIKERQDVPIIFHTAYEGENAPDCVSLKPFDYIYNGTPDSSAHLSSAVEHALG